LALPLTTVAAVLVAAVVEKVVGGPGGSSANTELMFTGADCRPNVSLCPGDGRPQVEAAVGQQGGQRRRKCAPRAVRALVMSWIADYFFSQTGLNLHIHMFNVYAPLFAKSGQGKLI
jgi:hypothetical protein